MEKNIIHGCGKVMLGMFLCVDLAKRYDTQDLLKETRLISSTPTGSLKKRPQIKGKAYQIVGGHR